MRQSLQHRHRGWGPGNEHVPLAQNVLMNSRFVAGSLRKVSWTWEEDTAQELWAPKINPPSVLGQCQALWNLVCTQEVVRCHQMLGPQLSEWAVIEKTMGAHSSV